MALRFVLSPPLLLLVALALVPSVPNPATIPLASSAPASPLPRRKPPPRALDLDERATSAQPDPCVRWAHQTAIASDGTTTPFDWSQGKTLWIYGGQARLDPDQTSNTWTNALLSVPLDTSWPAGTPPIVIADADSTSTSDTSPPAVAEGALWSSADGSHLLQTMGEFSDSDPFVTPPAQAVWAYDTSAKSWSTVTTYGDTVQRASEGATAVVPGAGATGEGVAYYFGGHLDVDSAYGWSDDTPRVYLSSMVRYDLGTANWVNETVYAGDAESGTSNSTSETSVPIYRADHTLTYVPQMGTNKAGIMVSIGGGNDESMIDNSVLDIYDLGTGGWTRQATQGTTLTPRTNHCAVRGSAVINNELQHTITVFAGQNGNQSERLNDVWMLTIPSFTWTEVGTLPGSPAVRAGHTCDIDGSMMIVVGGLVSENLMCDQPGVYVYNITSSTWATTFTPFTDFVTPDLTRNITGGQGIGNSTSGSGGAQGGNATVPTTTVSATSTVGLQSEHRSVDKGQIAMAVAISVGAFVGLVALGAFVLLHRRKSRRPVTLPAWLGGPPAVSRHKRIFSFDSDASNDSSSTTNSSMVAGAPYQHPGTARSLYRPQEAPLLPPILQRRAVEPIRPPPRAAGVSPSAPAQLEPEMAELPIRPALATMERPAMASTDSFYNTTYGAGSAFPPGQRLPAGALPPQVPTPDGETAALHSADHSTPSHSTPSHSDPSHSSPSHSTQHGSILANSLARREGFSSPSLVSPLATSAEMSSSKDGSPFSAPSGSSRSFIPPNAKASSGSSHSLVTPPVSYPHRPVHAASPLVPPGILVRRPTAPLQEHEEVEDLEDPYESGFDAESGYEADALGRGAHPFPLSYAADDPEERLLMQDAQTGGGVSKLVPRPLLRLVNAGASQQSLGRSSMDSR